MATEVPEEMQTSWRSETSEEADEDGGRGGDVMKSKAAAREIRWTHAIIFQRMHPRPRLSDAASHKNKASGCPLQVHEPHHTLQHFLEELLGANE